MNRILSIFGFFRHGHAESVSMRRDPLLLFRTFAPSLIERQELEVTHFHAPEVLAQWVRQSEAPNRLRLNWAVCSEGGRES